jgi:hypothetical protein
MTLNGSYNATFLSNNGGTAATAQTALLNGLDSGSAYFNIHSSVFPAGEIRGFLSAVPLPATLWLYGSGIAWLGTRIRRRY